jgi:hypothetical protein
VGWGVPVGVGSAFHAELLVLHAVLLALLEALLVVFHHFPAFVLPLQDLHSLAFELGLPPVLLLLPSLPLEGGKVFLEAFQRCFSNRLPSM